MTRGEAFFRQLLIAVAKRYFGDTRRQYQGTSQLPGAVFAEIDREVRSVICDDAVGSDQQANALIIWMRKYGILQGLKDVEEELAKVALLTTQSWGDNGARLDKQILMSRFGTLSNELTACCPKSKDGTERRVISMTSKLLWLQYPHSVPMFDNNANTSLNVLWRLYKSCVSATAYREKSATSSGQSDRPRKPIGIAPSQYDMLVYEDFYDRYMTLFRIISSDLEDMLLEPDEFSLEPIRFFDQLLWTIGSRSKDLGPAF